MGSIKTIQEMLAPSIFEVFEKMYFVFLESLKDTTGDYRIRSTITFSGSTSGQIQLFLSRGVAETMVKNMLGLNKDEIDLPIIADCVKESLNMICGNFVRKLDPDKPYNLSIPTFDLIADDGDKGPEVKDHQMDLAFVTDSGNIRVIMTAPEIL